MPGYNSSDNQGSKTNLDPCRNEPQLETFSKDSETQNRPFEKRVFDRQSRGDSPSKIKTQVTYLLDHPKRGNPSQFSPTNILRPRPTMNERTNDISGSYERELLHSLDQGGN